jgi:hypothetical protein
VPFDAETYLARLKEGEAARVRQRAAQKGQQDPFRRLLKTAGKPFLQGPWRMGSTGLVCHTESGHWGHVVFRQAQMERRPGFPSGALVTHLTAGAISPYLFEHVNRKDPTRPPPAGWEALHAMTGHQNQVSFSVESDLAELSWDPDLTTGQRNTTTWPVLGPESTGPWLAGVFEDLVPKTEAMCSDAAIRAYQLQQADRLERDGHTAVGALRDAVLLTWHLGLDGELPALLERAQAARAASPLPTSPRGSRNTMQWSHKAFVAFLNELPR